MPEGLKKIIGLAALMATIIITFVILNNILIGRSIVIEDTNNVTETNKSTEDYEALISSLPSGKLNFYQSSDGYQLSPTEYESLCKNTKIVTQRAMMGANITNISAQKLFSDNGNKIDKFSVKWDSSKNVCLAEYTIRALQGTNDTITVLGQAKGFLNTGVDTRVYFIKNF
tara:strand:+ start:893 stop:1405 length:513 start_codon:yes stop_codon:yes gene_type:complete